MPSPSWKHEAPAVGEKRRPAMRRRSARWRRRRHRRRDASGSGHAMETAARAGREQDRSVTIPGSALSGRCVADAVCGAAHARRWSSTRHRRRIQGNGCRPTRTGRRRHRCRVSGRASSPSRDAPRGEPVRSRLARETPPAGRLVKSPVAAQRSRWSARRPLRLARRWRSERREPAALLVSNENQAKPSAATRADACDDPCRDFSAMPRGRHRSEGPELSSRPRRSIATAASDRARSASDRSDPSRDIAEGCSRDCADGLRQTLTHRQRRAAAEIGGGASLRIAPITLAWVWPSNALRPAIISKSTAPSAKMSLRASDLAAFELLGRHVGNGSEDGPFDCQIRRGRWQR